MSLLRRRGSSGDPGRDEKDQPAPTPPPEAPRTRLKGGTAGAMANIGKSISIKGDVTGNEDTVVEGRVEGRIELSNHHLTVGPNGDVKGEISAKQVTVVGKVRGNVTATERIEVGDSGRVDGDLLSPRLHIREGAQFNGRVSMKPAAAAAGTQPMKVAPHGAKKVELAAS